MLGYFQGVIFTDMEAHADFHLRSFRTVIMDDGNMMTGVVPASLAERFGKSEVFVVALPLQ